jgi:hypothetical protein
MGRYVGLLVLLPSALLLVNFTSDVLSAWALVAHGEGDDGPTVAEAAMPNPLPLTGLIQTPTGRWGQGRALAASTTLSVQACTGRMISAQR